MQQLLIIHGLVMLVSTLCIMRVMHFLLSLLISIKILQHLQPVQFSDFSNYIDTPYKLLLAIQAEYSQIFEISLTDQYHSIVPRMMYRDY